jgi:hypothetical protein
MGAAAARGAGVTAPRRRAGVATFLIGAAAALGGARLFAPREGSASKGGPDPFGNASGRGAPSDAPSDAAVSAGYEPGDADSRGIFRTMAIYGGAALTAVALMVTLLHFLHRDDTARDAGLTATQRVQTTPPEPNLQADPVGDIARLRTHEYQLLHTVARIDADTARIPIDRAMALMAGQPLDRPDTQGDGKLPVQTPGQMPNQGARP